MRAGDELSDQAVLPGVVLALKRLCCASAPLAVELFCDGVLGLLLRIAQRLVAAKLQREGEAAAERALCECAALLLEAFSAAVPQARAHALPAPAVQGTCWCPCLGCGADRVPQRAGRRYCKNDGNRGERLHVPCSPPLAAAPCTSACPGASCDALALMWRWSLADQPHTQLACLREGWR